MSIPGETVIVIQLHVRLPPTFLPGLEGLILKLAEQLTGAEIQATITPFSLDN